MRPSGTLLAPAPPLLALALALAGCDDGELAVREAPPTPETTRDAPERVPLPPRPARVEHPSGLVVEIVEPGTGELVENGDRVRVHYVARLASDGSVVESTRESGIPFAFTLGAGEVIRGLERGLVGARVGDSLVLHVPAALAYGDRGLGSVPPGSDLTLDVRLLDRD